MLSTGCIKILQDKIKAGYEITTFQRAILLENRIHKKTIHLASVTEFNSILDHRQRCELAILLAESIKSQLAIAN